MKVGNRRHGSLETLIPKAGGTRGGNEPAEMRGWKQNVDVIIYKVTSQAWTRSSWPIRGQVSKAPARVRRDMSRPSKSLTWGREISVTLPREIGKFRNF